MQETFYDLDRYDVAESVRERHRTAAETVLERDHFGHLIDDEWVESDGGSEGVSIDPTTGERLATVQIGTAADVDRAVAAARRAFEGHWGQLSPKQRGEHLDEIADRLEERKVAIAKLESLEVGKPNMHSLFVDAEILVEQFRYFAAVARTESVGRVVPTAGENHAVAVREPYGVVGAISAWNFPAMFVAWKLAPALAAGNTVVFKPSPRAVLATLVAARVCTRVLPSGTVNVVTGWGEEVGAAISGHEGIDKVSMTGSRQTGVAVLQAAAETITPATVELGGKSPNIIFPDADLEQAVEGTLVSIFFNSGQQCTAGSRLFLHEAIGEEFLELLLARIDELSVGDPLLSTTDIGPMIDHAHQASVREYIDGALENGATATLGGSPVPSMAGGAESETAGAPFIEPTIVTDVSDDDRIACEEVFGPVLTVLEWSDRSEMIRRANATEYGLAAGVWTSDLQDAHEVARALEAGTVWVNNYNDLLDPTPHGGFKESGIGRELGREALDEHSQVKTMKFNFGEIPRFG